MTGQNFDNKHTKLAESVVRSAGKIHRFCTGGLSDWVRRGLERHESVLAGFKTESSLAGWTEGTRELRKLCLVIACCAMAACGGGGGGSEPQPTIKQPVVVSIDAEGDSTMFGWTQTGPNTFIQSPSNQPAVIASDLGIQVTNNGVGGATVGSAIAGTQPNSQPLVERLKTMKAQIVIGNYLINDARLNTVEQYRDGLNGWINIVRAAGKTPVLEEPNPIAYGLDPDSFALIQDAYVGVLRDVAKAQGVLLIAQYDYVKTLDWKSMTPDGLHPNEVLYKIMGDRAADQIKDLVKSIQQ
jgi:lysophospholipase L1-like esterase